MASRILTSVVTGASGGLGGALSKRLLQDGWHVAMIARSKDKMKSIVDSLATDSSNRSCIIGADLMDPKQCKSAHEEAVEWLNDVNNGNLDLLVNNCGGAKLKIDLENCDLDTWYYHMNLNVTSTFLMSQLFIPQLSYNCNTDCKNDENENTRENSNGNQSSIVNIGSISGIRPYSGSFAYCVSKAAVDQITQCAAMELAPKKIRVNCIRPSTIRTDFHKNAGMSQSQADGYYNSVGQFHMTTNTVGDVNDVIEMILFLADNDKSKWITGQSITLDGGRLLQTPALHNKFVGGDHE